MRWRVLLGLPLIFLSAGFWHGSLPVPGTVTWTQVKLGAGGQTVELVMQPCGAAMQLARTDTYTPYYRQNGSAWAPLFTPAMQGDLVGGIAGAWAIACAPSKPTRLAVINNGFLFESDGLIPWVKKTAFTRITGSGVDPNGSFKYTRQKIAFDPVNDNVAYAATNNNGIIATFNNFTSVATVADITASTTAGGGAGIAFDPNSGTTTCPGGSSPCTNAIWVGSFGNGVFYSGDGGTTWNNLVAATAVNLPAFTTVSANSYIVIDIQTNQGTITSISDTSSLSWTQRATVGDTTTSSLHSYEYYALASSAITTTITINTTVGTLLVRAGVFGVNGADLVTPFDPNLTSACTSSSGAPTCTTINANDFVVSFVHGAPTGTDAEWSVLNSEAPTKAFFSEYIIPGTTVGPGPFQGTGATATSGITDAFRQASGKAIALDGTPKYIDSVIAPAGPVNVYSGRVAPDGAYWATDQAFVWKCVISGTSCSGGWTKIDVNGPLGGSGFINAAPPNNSHVGYVVFVQNAGGFGETITNNGTLLVGGGPGGCSTFPYFMIGGSCAGGPNGAITISATQIPWLAIVGGTASGGDADYDPGTGNLCVGEGVGVFCGPVPTATQSCGIYTCLPSLTMDGNASLDIEDMVGNDSLSPPGGYPLMLMDDRPIFQISNPSVYPSAYSINNSFNYAYQADYGGGNAAIVCARLNFGFPASPTEQSGCSNNYGAPGSWTVFSTSPPNVSAGGGIAVADANNIVLNTSGSGTASLDCTTDGGGSWQTSHASGGSASCQGLPASGWGTSKPICADKISIGTFYAVTFPGGIGATYSTTNLANAWSNVTVTTPQGGSTGGITKIVCNPYVAGDLWLATAMFTNSSGNHFLNHSTDGGKNWQSVSIANGYGSDITSLDGLGIGAGVGGIPTLYIVGYKDGTKGNWRSADLGQTWTNLGTYPILDYATSINGDMNDANSAYVSTQSSGAFKVQLNYLLKRDIDPALSLSDVGNEITCTVTATNAAGSASTTSAYVVVAAQLKYAVQL